MTKLTKTRTIGMIALAALLVVAGIGTVLAAAPANHFYASEWMDPVPPSAPPPACPSEGAEPGKVHSVEWMDPVPPSAPPPPYDAGAPAAPLFEVFDPVPPSAPPPACPSEGAEPGKVRSAEKTRIEVTTDPDTGEQIYVQSTVRTGILNPWRVGGHVHGRAYTHAPHVSGVHTRVIVEVELWRWDGLRWILKAAASAVDTSPWLGWYRAEATPVAVGVTGWWATTARHRVYRDGVRVHHSTSESGWVHLTFP
jgi:hypothetical protein